MSAKREDYKDFIGTYVALMKKFWIEIEPDFLSVIAATRGWLPLELNEKMHVTYGDKKYTIERTK